MKRIWVAEIFPHKYVTRKRGKSSLERRDHSPRTGVSSLSFRERTAIIYESHLENWIVIYG